MTPRELFVLIRASIDTLKERLEYGGTPGDGVMGWESPLADLRAFVAQLEWQLQPADRTKIGPRQAPPMERENMQRLIDGGEVTVEPRKTVHCDESCGAFDEPQTPDEIRAAFEHWRDHSSLGGCSHGC